MKRVIGLISLLSAIVAMPLHAETEAGIQAKAQYLQSIPAIAALGCDTFDFYDYYDRPMSELSRTVIAPDKYGHKHIIKNSKFTCVIQDWDRPILTITETISREDLPGSVFDHKGVNALIVPGIWGIESTPTHGKKAAFTEITSADSRLLTIRQSAKGWTVYATPFRDDPQIKNIKSTTIIVGSHQPVTTHAKNGEFSKAQSTQLVQEMTPDNALTMIFSDAKGKVIYEDSILLTSINKIKLLSGYMLQALK